MGVTEVSGPSSSGASRQSINSSTSSTGKLFELVICSLEPGSPGAVMPCCGTLEALGSVGMGDPSFGGMTVAGVNIPPRVRAYSKDFSQSRGNMHIGGSNDISSSASNENRSHGSASSSTRDGSIGNESTNIKENNINNGTVSAEEVSGNDTMPLASLSEGVQADEGDGTKASGLGRLQQERTSIVQDRQMRRSRGNSIGSRL